MSKQWIGTKEAADLLGVCQRTVQTWVDEGKLKSSRTAGGHRRLSLADIREFTGELQPQRINPNTQLLPAGIQSDILRVLVVEDDPLMLRNIEYRFSKFDIQHQLFVAKDAYHGLIMVGRHLPQVIFTDLLMPEINGLQMIRAIVALPEMAASKIVAITGLEAREIMKMGKLPEGIIILHKPIPFETVETILYQHAVSLNLMENKDSEHHSNV